MSKQAISADEGPALKDLTIRIVQDNYRSADRLEAAWGFAAHLIGPQENILFDTGSDGALLLGNMGELDIDPNRIETVVLSHNHADHTGGLVSLLKQNASMTICGLESFPTRFQRAVRGYGARFVAVSRPQPICPNVCSAGQMGTRIREQALIVRTERGPVVLTGCAHPGVVRMIEKVRALHEEEILLVLGGFHLGWAQAAEIQQIIRSLKNLGVRYVAPTHCSGDKARALFRQHFGAHYLEVGVGKTISLADLK
ncbi:MAG: MBL fold metallo-hydrolase [Phycisphaerales bacterium]|nr:MAG: MBL fold metallo-hydrolase [Phycisphaerales bacterium]